jgi:hypothetical protein
MADSVGQIVVVRRQGRCGGVRINAGLLLLLLLPRLGHDMDARIAMVLSPQARSSEFTPFVKLTPGLLFTCIRVDRKHALQHARYEHQCCSICLRETKHAPRRPRPILQASSLIRL